MRKLHWLLGSVVGLLVTGAALDAQVSAPVLGFVPDGDRVRPVFGIPAAAAIAAPFSTSRGFARVAASPQQDYLLVSAADNGEVLLLGPDGSLKSLRGAGAGPDEIAISPEGSAAALWFASANRAQVITGLRPSQQSPPQIREISTSFLESSPYALAVSDDGQWLAGAWRSGNYAFGPHGEVNRLPVEDIVSSVAFLHGQHNLVIGTHEQILMADVGGANQPSVLLSGQGRLDPVAVAVAGGNQKMVFANPRGRITMVDLTSGAVQTAECQCSPKGLIPMGTSVFRLTGMESGAFQVFDSDSGQVFAATLVAAAQGGQQ